MDSLLVISLKVCLQPVTWLVSRLVFMVLIWHSWQTCGFKIIWSQDLVKQLWPPDGCRMTVNAFYSTRKKLEVDGSKWMIWREERLKSRKNPWLPAIGEEGQPHQSLVRTTFSSFSRPNHIEILVLSILFFLSVRSLKINTFFKNMATLGHRWNIKFSQLKFRFV